MAIIAQTPLFSWEEIEDLGDLRRLHLALEYLPDKTLMNKLEKHRGKGRNDYPIRPMWNSIIAGIVFQHPSKESLRRELMRNAQLRQLCGFDPLKGVEAVPKAHTYTRFLRLLMKHQDEVKGIFESLVKGLSSELPDFGEILAMDGKGIASHSRQASGKSKESDGRRDSDADWGVKKYRGQNKDGTLWEKVKSWFGYNIHLVVDASYELPVAFELTKASKAEQPVAKGMLEHLEHTHPEIIQQCKYALADRGYDDTQIHCKLWGEYGIKAVIDIRNQWKAPDGEDTRVVSGTTNVTYDYKGNVFCSCPATGEVRAMAYGGFEQSRQSQKYRCPAKHYGLKCRGEARCELPASIRIRLDEDRRVFTPVARCSYKWKKLYKKRTSVERVNSRLDVSFGFENHFIRGKQKMKLQCSLALSVMLAMALGRIKEKQEDNIRSLVKAVA